ncbi:MAG: hypothetical protein HDS16_05945 [Bacteroides sp.]|nr:hypothetical protein [Bacteroides sp.]
MVFTQTWHATSLHSSGNRTVFNQTWHATSLHSSGNGTVFAQALYAILSSGNAAVFVACRVITFADDFLMSLEMQN